MIIPAVDLINGKVVRLCQGKFNEKTTYAYDPIHLLESWVEQGATQLHLVDLDGAKDTSHRQTILIEEILKNVNAQIQVGGGIRSDSDIEVLLNAGANRIVLGSVAVTHPDSVKAWIQRFGSNAIVLALDIRLINEIKQVATHGWQQLSTLALEDVLNIYKDTGLKHILCTDISRDGAFEGSNIALYKQLTNTFPDILWQASGGVTDLKDIIRLQSTKVSGVIIGRALLEEKFTFMEAQQCWQNV